MHGPSRRPSRCSPPPSTEGSSSRHRPRPRRRRAPRRSPRTPSGSPTDRKRRRVRCAGGSGGVGAPSARRRTGPRGTGKRTARVRRRRGTANRRPPPAVPGPPGRAPPRPPGRARPTWRAGRRTWWSTRRRGRRRRTFMTPPIGSRPRPGRPPERSWRCRPGRTCPTHRGASTPASARSRRSACWRRRGSVVPVAEPPQHLLDREEGGERVDLVLARVPRRATRAPARTSRGRRRCCPPAANPIPPWRTEARSVMMSPIMLVATATL